MKLKRDYVNERLNGHYFSWHMMQKEGDVNKKKTSQKLRAADKRLDAYLPSTSTKPSTSDTESDINSLIREL